MNNFVNFNKLAEENYHKLESKDIGTFYLTENNLYLGDTLLSSNIATSDTYGIVKPDNNSIKIDSEGALHICWEDIPEPPLLMKPFCDATLSEIVRMVKAADEGILDLVSDCGWEVGQQKLVTLPAISKSGTYGNITWDVNEDQELQDIILVLMDTGDNAEIELDPEFVNKTNRESPYPNFIVGMKDCLSASGSFSKSEHCTWLTSSRRIWCNSGFKEAMNKILPNIFKPFISYYIESLDSTEMNSCIDYFALPSLPQIISLETSYNCNTIEFSKYTQLQWYADPANWLKHQGNYGPENTSMLKNYWTKSMTAFYDTAFSSIRPTGTPSESNVITSRGISPMGVI